MAYMLQISDPEELVITCTIPGKYNPDLLDDLKARVLDTYKEALSFRVALGVHEARTILIDAEGNQIDGE